MNEKFTAKVAHASKTEYYYMVGFADDAIEPEKYIILQRAHEFDERDMKLGMDGEYIEVNGQENSGYKCCRQASLTDHSFTIELETDAEDVFRVEIDFDGISISKDLTHFLTEILGTRLTVK